MNLPSVGRAKPKALEAIDPNLVIGSLYLALLAKMPDPQELREGLSALERGVPLYEVIGMILRSPGFTARLPEFKSQYNLVDDRLIHDVAQFGEVALLIEQIVASACPERTVVDVGARGRALSNSYDLIKHFGWRGLLVEANPALIAPLERDFAGLDCEVVHCAVTDREGTATLMLGVNDDVSAIDPVFAGAFGPPRGAVEVPARRLPSLLREHAIPEVFSLLSLDIEGEDLKALNDLIDQSPYRPRWIILEASMGKTVRSLADVACSTAVVAQYEIVAWTMPNLILGRKDRPGRTEPVLR